MWMPVFWAFVIELGMPLGTVICAMIDARAWAAVAHFTRREEPYRSQLSSNWTTRLLLATSPR